MEANVATVTVTSDLSQFGFRELKMAAELLIAYCANPPSQLGDGIHVCMNTSSGNVFLSDEEFNVAMLNGDKIEMFWACPECGREGFADEIGWNAEHYRCDAHDHLDDENA